VVQRLFNWAVTDRRITANPIKGVRVKKGSRRRATTEAEYQLMLKASSPCFRRALVFLRWNGCRPQDMTRLQWEWIVWRDGRPYKAVVPKDRHKTGGKTGKDKVILFAPVACQLVSWLARRPPEQPARTGHVFQNSRGEPWTRGALSQRLGQIRDDTKISIEATFHGLRHLVGTQWVARGGSMDLLAAWMCHMTSRTTETYYVHREVMEIELLEQARLLIGPRTNRS
jgi:integrase